jgi:hypothetical protein
MLVLRATASAGRILSSLTFGIDSPVSKGREAETGIPARRRGMSALSLTIDARLLFRRNNGSNHHQPKTRRISSVKWYVNIAAVALLSSSLLCSTAVAAGTDKDAFSAVQGVNAQALSLDEMQATSGQLNAYDIAAALTAAAAKLAKYPKLQAADLKLANWYQVNAVAVNAEFQKLGILTPCKSCK